jgi:hypothetical protein
VQPTSGSLRDLHAFFWLRVFPAPKQSPPRPSDMHRKRNPLAVSSWNFAMKKEIRYRLNGLEFIIHNLHHNAALMKYMSFNLHKEPFNLFNNIGLYWIWGQTISDQILDFYKVMRKDEKFSFPKIINVAKELKSEVNYNLLEKETNALKTQYDKTDFEKVRSKYIAHQDLRVPQIKTDLLTTLSLTEKTIEVFLLFSKEFKGRKVNLSDNVVVV